MTGLSIGWAPECCHQKCTVPSTYCRPCWTCGSRDGGSTRLIKVLLQQARADPSLDEETWLSRNENTVRLAPLVAGSIGIGSVVLNRSLSGVSWYCHSMQVWWKRLESISAVCSCQMCSKPWGLTHLSLIVCILLYLFTTRFYIFLLSWPFQAWVAACSSQHYTWYPMVIIQYVNYMTILSIHLCDTMHSYVQKICSSSRLWWNALESLLVFMAGRGIRCKLCWLKDGRGTHSAFSSTLDDGSAVACTQAYHPRTGVWITWQIGALWQQLLCPGICILPGDMQGHEVQVQCAVAFLVPEVFSLAEKHFASSLSVVGLEAAITE